MIYAIMMTLALVWETRSVGMLAGVFMVLYGFKRFSIEFLRGEFPRVFFKGLTVWQWFSLAFMGLGIGITSWVVQNGSTIGAIQLSAGIQGLGSASAVLLLTSVILGAAYGTHGRKIGSW